MELISATFEDVVHDGSHVAPVFGAVIGNHLDFRDRILIPKKVGRSSDRVVIVILAVDLKIVRTGALSIDREICAVIVAESRIAYRGDSRHKQR